jgi:hypothetical protein
MDKNAERKRRYYERNRNKILGELRYKRENRKPTRGAKRRSDMMREVRRFFDRMADNISNLFRSVSVEKIGVSLLTAACTVYLVSESAKTLHLTEGQGAFLAAILCEILLVGVSMLPVFTLKMQIMRGVVLFGIVVLTLLNTLGGPLSVFSQSRQGVQLKEQEVAILSESLAQKKILLERYISTNRISGAGRLESEIATLSSQLQSLKKEQSGQKSDISLILGLAITALMRLVILAANVILSTRLGDLFRNENGPKRPNTVPTKNTLRLVRT